MSFSDKQRKALRAKLSWRHVKTRAVSSGTIAYVEGWHAIAEANRIFGYDCWDRTTVSPRCLWSETRRGLFACFYSTKVRITVRAGASVITREGIGTGFGQSPVPETAHEMALKAAETDATKRALATFGNPFGLALYDKDQAHVTKPPSKAKEVSDAKEQRQKSTGDGTKDLVLFQGERRTPFSSSEAFTAAVLRAIPTLRSIDAVYDFWERNLEGFKELRRRAEGQESDPVVAIVATLKGRARALGYQAGSDGPVASKPEGPRTSGAEINRGKGMDGRLAIPKEQRIRDKDHLVYVASKPCIVCGRRGAQAHHLRFAQQRAMAMKVSDEYTVPLCVAHHDALHRTGDEQAWWARHGIIDPLKIAARLWAESRGHVRHEDGQPEDGRPEDVQPEDHADERELERVDRDAPNATTAHGDLHASNDRAGANGRSGSSGPTAAGGPNGRNGPNGPSGPKGPNNPNGPNDPNAPTGPNASSSRSE
jgi:DNA recombination protein Rad52